MPIRSAGILLYRNRSGGTEVFLVHPGGPYWANKDDGAWSVPKGIVESNENELAAACREFEEETGFGVAGKFRELGTFQQPSGKQLSVWALEGDCEPSKLVSNRFEMIWPPKSGKRQSFPEVDRGAWFTRSEALVRIVKGQKPIVEKLFRELTLNP
ncbi:MAG: NUDIX domain-containing protein [Rhizomicrobium sp.]